MSVRRGTRQHYRHFPAWLDGVGPEVDVVLSTGVRIIRNLDGCRFPQQASVAERAIAFRQIVAAIKAEPRLGEFSIINFSDLPVSEQQIFAEKRVADFELAAIQGDHGIAVDDEFRVSIQINGDDHVAVRCLDAGCDPVEAWKTADGIDDLLGEKLDFAFDKKNGFLTSRPEEAGAGLSVSFLMHLPGLVLTKTVESVLQGGSQMGLRTRSFPDRNAEVSGNLFMVSAGGVRGTPEREFVKNSRQIVKEIVRHEREARKRLIREARLELTDKIYRACGILQYAQMLSMGEFLNLASALRLGIEYCLFTDIDIKEVNRATIAALPAHLGTGRPQPPSESELAVLRAGLARKMLFRRKRKQAARS